MINQNFPRWEQIHTIVFDFDGVANNKVFVDQAGIESVCCDGEMDCF